MDVMRCQHCLKQKPHWGDCFEEEFMCADCQLKDGVITQEEYVQACRESKIYGVQGKDINSLVFLRDRLFKEEKFDGDAQRDWAKVLDRIIEDAVDITDKI